MRKLVNAPAPLAYICSRVKSPTADGWLTFIMNPILKLLAVEVKTFVMLM